MKPANVFKSGITAGAIACLCSVAFAAPATFKEAVNEYNSGKYGDALTKFQTLQRTNTTNATLHYYSAMCFQSLGKMSEARSEFQYVASNGDPTLQVYAQRALAALNKKTTGMNSAQFAVPNPGQAGSFLSTVAPNVSGMQVAAPPPPSNPSRR